MTKKKFTGTINEHHIRTALLDVLSALGGTDYQFYTDLEIKSYNESERAQIKLTLVVHVSDRSGATRKIVDTLNRTGGLPKGMRAINDKDNQIDISLGDVLPFSKQKLRILIKPLGGGSGGGSAQTALVESAQCLYASLVFNVLKEKMDTNAAVDEAQLTQARAFCDIPESVNDIKAIDSAWRSSSILGANELYDRFNKAGMNYRFARGLGVDGIIGELHKKYKGDRVPRSDGSEGFEVVPQQEDKWNPADMWMISNPKVVDELNNANGIVMLNNVILDKWRSRELIGVSLKKMTSNANYSVINETRLDTSNVVYQSYDYTYDSIDVYINMGGSRRMQMRNTGGDSTLQWQGELKGVGAAQGKIGGGGVFSVLEAIGGYTGGFTNATEKTMAENGSSSEYIATMLEKHGRSAGGLSTLRDTGSALLSDIANNKKASWRYSKKLGLTVIDVLESDKNKADEICKALYLYASSQSKLSSVHVKLQ